RNTRSGLLRDAPQDEHRQRAQTETPEHRIEVDVAPVDDGFLRVPRLIEVGQVVRYVLGCGRSVPSSHLSLHQKSKQIRLERQDQPDEQSPPMEIRITETDQHQQTHDRDDLEELADDEGHRGTWPTG